LAFESEVKAGIHHYIVGEKLIRMHERIGKDRVMCFVRLSEMKIRQRDIVVNQDLVEILYFIE
jgi:hypothetical protein